MKPALLFDYHETKMFGQVWPAHSLVWSPTGLHLAFCHDLVRVVVLSLANGSSVSFEAGQRPLKADALSWSSTGEYLAWSNSESEIRIARSDGGKPLLVGQGQAVQWKGSGTQLVFWNDASTFCLDVPEQKIEKVNYRRGSWSPTGKRVAYLEADNRVYLANVDGSNPILLETLVGENRLLNGMNLWADSVCWSPNGDQLLYTQKTDQPRIYVLHADGSALQLFAEGVKPRWSYSGRRILYQREGSKQIFLGNLNQDAPHMEVASGDAYAWSPVDDEIVFSTTEGVFRVNI